MKKSKMIALVMAVVLMVGAVIGGTIAWLTDETETVTNVFTTSGIEATLVETTNGEDSEGNYNTEGDYKMIPGWTIAKDPKAGVTAESEDCYLFVEVEMTENVTQFLEYEIDKGWAPVPGTTNVYYKEFSETTQNAKGTKYSILANDQVKVKDDVTMDMMAKITAKNQPELEFTAYAVQLYKNNTQKFDPAEAWAEINK